MSASNGTAVAPSGELPQLEHWAFQVDSPFRPVAEVQALTEAGGEAAAAEDALGETDTGWLPDSLGEDFLEAEDLYEAFEEPEADDNEADVREADLLDETPASEHPLAAVFALPRIAFEAMRKGAWQTAIAAAIGAGNRDVNKLTNMVFWFRHPQLIGQRLRPDQRDLALEWVEIRDQIVRPAIAGAGAPDAVGPAPSVPASPSSPSPRAPAAGGGRTSIPSDVLRWYGPASQDSPELRSFMRKVYDLHVERSKKKGDFVDTLPRDHLEEIWPGSGHWARSDAAKRAREMFHAARAAIAREGLNGSIRIGVRSAYRSADEQLDIWQGKSKKGKGGFPAYYRETMAERRKPKYGGEHSDAAAAALVDHMAWKVAAPGYSNHQDGLALDLSTRKGPGGLVKLYEGSWFHTWLIKHATKEFDFHPLAGEPWHWVYRPRGGAATEAWEEAESGPMPAYDGQVGAASGIRAGRHEVTRTPVLSAHRGKGPDLVLRWNDMPAMPAAIDVAVHLHGYSVAGMTLPRNIEVWSGLDLQPVDGGVGAGRARPTLTVLPRGHYTGIPSGRIYRYTFPALTTRDGLTQLIAASLEAFAGQVGGTAPKLGRLIVTAHSGGGAPLMHILRQHDPHEVHVFDGLYQDATPLAAWAKRHIAADRAAVEGGGEPAGAMRVYFRPGTRKFSLRLLHAIARGLSGAPQQVVDRYRVEASTLGHWQIARQYGWRLLADAGADVPDARRPLVKGSAAVAGRAQRLFEAEDELEAASHAFADLGPEDETEEYEDVELQGLDLVGPVMAEADEFEEPEADLELERAFEEEDEDLEDTAFELEADEAAAHAAESGGPFEGEDEVEGLAESLAVESQDEGPMLAGMPPADTGLLLQEAYEEAEQSLTDRIKSALTSRLWPVAVGLLVTAGVRDENRLTNVLFHANHPELGGRSIRADEKTLMADWLRIRDATIRPLLQRISTGTAVPPAGSAGTAGTEYIPAVGAPEFGRRGSTPEELGRKDLDSIYQSNITLRERVVRVATALDLDPGLLAANLHAEVSSPSVWAKTSGTVASEKLGLDDWFDPVMATYLRRVIRDHPGVGLAYADVRATGDVWDTSTEKAGGAMKPRGTLDAAKAVAAVGVYMAGGEAMLRKVIQNHAARTGKPLPGLETLPAEQRFTILRVAFNAGVVPARNLLLEIAAGGDIPRTGKTTRDRRNARRTAVLHMARAIHLSQAIFARPSSLYRPTP